MSAGVLRRINPLSLLIIALTLSIIVLQEYVRPWIAESYYRAEYQRLTFACDMAMHEEAALRQQADSTNHQALHLSADVDMMICHDYDLLRKKLLGHGVSENHLAMLGLAVLEVEQVTVRQMVDAHRMDRF